MPIASRVKVPINPSQIRRKPWQHDRKTPRCLPDQDTDPQETQEWQDALTGVIEHEGTDRAHFLIEQMIAQRARKHRHSYSATTEYINTIPADRQPKYPGDADIEIRIRNYIRWNAMAMVVRANRTPTSAGISPSFHRPPRSTTSVSTGSGVRKRKPRGDLIFSRGTRFRAFIRARFHDGSADRGATQQFPPGSRRQGLPSYPHPWLMPDFWRFPTVSMGLGPIQAIYQARFMKYMDSRGFIDAKDRKVWAFLGDGETDEVESLGAIGMAAREKLTT